ncbi:actin cytoskeleton and mitosis protein [Sorochytrium milnesiophthora]
MNFTRFGDRQDADDLARHDVMSSVASTNAARFGASDDGTLEAQFKKERARREALQTARRDMDAPVLRGTCDSMCPPFEALERTFRNEADFFERSDMSNDRSKYVKAYKRSAAGDGALLVEDLRTLPALQATWRHLLSLVDQHGIASTHNFVWNRSRAVRKDLMAQTLYSPDALVLYQQIVRYHLYVLQQLSGAENFERFQEIEQLNNALVSVFDCYKELNMDPQAAPASCVEFVAYARLLWNLQTRPRKEVIALCQVFRRRPAIRQSTALLKILKAIETDASTGDADFRIAAVQSYFAWMASPHTPYLLAVAGSFYLDRVRFWTLQSFARAGFQSSGGLVPTTLSMAELTELLHFRDVDECRDFVDICGLDIAPVDTVAFGRKTSSGALQLEGALQVWSFLGRY